MTTDRDSAAPTATATTTSSGGTTSSATGAGATAGATWQHDVAARLAHHASPHELATYLAGHVARRELPAVMTFLQQNAGNRFATQTIAAWSEAGAGPLSGAMLVSNNPEGIASPGALVTTDVAAGPVAAYVHHSNHMAAPLDLYLVVKPRGQPVATTLDGAAAVTGGATRARAPGASAEWAADPNVVVAAANTDADAAPRAHIHQVAAGPTPIHLGRLPAAHGGDPPLFDARYAVELSADAELAVVAERAGGGAAAAHESKPATGNTKYEQSTTNGRAAGLYTGAQFASDDTVAVSRLPHRTALTGGKGSHAATPTLARGAASAERVTMPTASALAPAIALARAGKLDDATIQVLGSVFRIAPAWLRERGAWNGTTLDAGALTGDYQTIIDGVRGSLAADARDDGARATLAFIAAHSQIGASADFASYGTRFELAYLLDNDTAHAARVGLDFITDVHPDAHGHGAVYRGLVEVDGVEHAIANDHAHGEPAAVTHLGPAIAVEPAQSKYVKIALESPGQVSAGQAIELTKQ